MLFAIMADTQEQAWRLRFVFKRRFDIWHGAHLPCEYFPPIGAAWNLTRSWFVNFVFYSLLLLCLLVPFLGRLSDPLFSCCAHISCLRNGVLKHSTHSRMCSGKLDAERIPFLDPLLEPANPCLSQERSPEGLKTGNLKTWACAKWKIDKSAPSATHPLKMESYG